MRQQLLFISCLLALSSAQTEYAVLLDAGSSSTKLAIFEWEKEDRLNLNLFPDFSGAPANKTQWTTKTAKSLNFYGADASAAAKSLQPMIDYANSKIPEQVRASTQLYLTSTAGMRALPQKWQDATIAAVREYLSTAGYLFKPEWAQIITGEDEGAYGWVAVNYLLSRLTGKTKDTVGSLDLGGSSTQIAFVPKDGYKGSGISELYVGNLDPFPVYSVSYVGLGVDQLALSLQAMTAARGSTVYPCFPKGYSADVKLNNGSVITFIGSSDFVSCNKLIKMRLNITTPGAGPNGTPRPTIPVDQPFYAYSAFAYPAQTFGLPSDASLWSIYQAAGKFCGYDLKEARAHSNNSSFAHTFCLVGSFTYQLLTKGYGFNKHSNQIQFKSDIDGVALTYAPGAVLYKVASYFTGGGNVSPYNSNNVFAKHPMLLKSPFRAPANL